MKKQIAALATDEENMVMWDMDAVLSDYQNHPSMSVNTQMLIPQNWLTIDPSYALTTNVSTPIILFEIPDNQLYIADGNHRLYRAAMENHQQMNVIVVPQEKHLGYLYKSGVEDYHHVIHGLKDEGIFIKSFLHK